MQVNNQEVLNCYYAHSDQQDGLQVRIADISPLAQLCQLLFLTNHMSEPALPAICYAAYNLPPVNAATLLLAAEQ